MKKISFGTMFHKQILSDFRKRKFLMETTIPKYQENWKNCDIVYIENQIPVRKLYVSVPNQYVSSIKFHMYDQTVFFLFR